MANRPVIAHVLHRLDRAGAEVLAAGLARGLADRFDFVFFCLDGLGPLADELIDEGFAVEALDRRPGLDRALARRLRDRAAHHRVDLIHAHQYTPFFYSALARGVLSRQLLGTGVLFTEHGRHVPDTPSLKRRLANKLFLKKTDRVTAVSAFVKDALIKHEGLPASRIDIVHNGIDPGPEPTDNDREQAREQLGLSPDRPVVMQVARFHPVKDHATALRAWSIVHAQMPEALLVFVGDGPERENLESLTKQLGLEDAVRFTGAINNARDLIPAADLCMLSSLSEGLSVTLLEAMAAGKPIVATDVGGNPEAVVNGETGLLAPARDPEALAGCIIQLLPNAPYTARALGQAGRQRLLEHFTADRMHRVYADRYELLAADASSR
jgi:glycosyltransferase involved in cell wall biosynthesis